ncbi:hypothetical protein PR048_026004 [Dryococelus australis]|uniref:Uncharacterized protein n=1 Tax=Dryococelus australis TaxID=614101 RepID=A0ABQ9GK45_9NEOP|nr:hypothetical protein PR048_026004 [Dryococelus australis]
MPEGTQNCEGAHVGVAGNLGRGGGRLANKKKSRAPPEVTRLTRRRAAVLGQRGLAKPCAPGRGTLVVRDWLAGITWSRRRTRKGKAVVNFVGGRGPAAPILADQQARPADVRRGARQTHPRRSEGKPSPTANIFSTLYGTDIRLGQYKLGSPLVDDRAIMNAVKYRAVSGGVWTNRTMVSSNTDTNRTGVLAVVDINLICTVQRYDGNTVRLARRSDEMLEVLVSVARIAPSRLDIGLAGPSHSYIRQNNAGSSQLHAPAYTTSCISRRRKELNRWIGLGSDSCSAPLWWSPRIPDLTTPGKALQGFIEESMWKRRYLRMYFENMYTQSTPRRTEFDSRWSDSVFARGNRVVRRCLSSSFLGDLPFFTPLNSGTAPCPPLFTLIGSQDTYLRRNFRETLGSHSWAVLNYHFARTPLISEPARGRLHPPLIFVCSLATVCLHFLTVALFGVRGEAETTDYLKLHKCAPRRVYCIRTKETGDFTPIKIKGSRGGVVVRLLAQREPSSIPGGHEGMVTVEGADRRVFPGISCYPALADKIDVKHVYTKVDFEIGSQFTGHSLDDSEPIADLQGNK